MYFNYNKDLNYSKIVLGLNEAIYNKDGVDEEKEKNHYEVIEQFYDKILIFIKRIRKTIGKNRLSLSPNGTRYVC